MSDWQNRYRQKLISAEDAAKLVRSGNRMYWGLAHGAAFDFDAAVAQRVHELQGVQVYSTLPMRRGPFATYTAAASAGEVQFNSCHFGGPERKMAKDKGCWFVPIQFRELPKYWRENVPVFDLTVAQVGPMDAFGNFNLGPQVADFWGVIDNSRCVIVEVNENMPFAHGHQVSLPLNRVDYIIEGSNPPLVEVPPVEPTEIEVRMAKNIVGMIEDGSTLQLGIGGIPNTIGSLLCSAGIGDLSVHTEMLVDAYVDLYNAGKITGNKRMDKGKMVYSFCGGTRKLYDFIDGNPVCCCGPVDYVNDIGVISQNEKMISINSCLQVDLYGQVSAESAGYRQISGTGGQLDFVLGAFLSKGGKSFLCTPSARRRPDGTLESLIVPAMPAGTVVTTPRSATQYVVTEYGIVNLKGKSSWDRAELLISIAHPEVRDALIREAEKMGIWTRSGRIPE